MSTALNLLAEFGGFGEGLPTSLASVLLDKAGITAGTRAIKSVGAAYPYIISGVRQGMDLDEIQSALSNAGLGIRRQNLSRVVSLLKTEFGYPSHIPNPLRSKFPASGTFRFGAPGDKKRYTFVVQFKVRNPTTGQTETGHVSVSSDSMLTLDEIENQTLAFGVGDYINQFSEYVSSEVVRTWVSPTAGGGL